MRDLTMRSNIGMLSAVSTTTQLSAVLFCLSSHKLKASFLDLVLLISNEYLY